jgi:lysophospholipase L1-like esterase
VTPSGFRLATAALPALLSACGAAHFNAPAPRSAPIATAQAEEAAQDASNIIPVAERGPGTRRTPAKVRGAADRLSPSEQRLAPLFEALEGIETGAASGPVTILQIGDSHTAGDFLSGQMRKLFQARFGGAGRGFLPPGFPDKYYRPDLVTVEESKGWRRGRSMNMAEDGHFGIAGVVQQATEPGQQMMLTSTEEPGFDRGFIELLGPGAFRLSVDDAPARNFNVAESSDSATNWVEFDVPPHSHALKLETAGDHGLTLLSWGIERRGAGILYDNLGAIGATANLIGRWDPAIVASELRHLDPSLIIIAFGTNEAFGNAADLADFRESFIDQVRMLANDAPGAAIVIVGPPDVNRRYRRPPGVSGECTVRPLNGPPLSGPAPVTSATRKAHPVRAAAIWAPPPELTTVRADERSAAESEGWYFWDWSVAMGGPCSAHRWATLAEPLSRPDHVHQTIAGYQLTAQRLFDELMAGYDHYRKVGVPVMGATQPGAIRR